MSSSIKNVQSNTVSPNFNFFGSNSIHNQFPVQNQTPISLFNQKHRQRNKISHKSRFTKEEDAQLIDLVKIYGPNEWTLISKHMTNRNSRQCRERWKNYINPQLSTTAWTKEEDYIMLKKFQEIGHHWKIISLYVNNRSINSVRNRIVKLNRSINSPYKFNYDSTKSMNVNNPQALSFGQFNYNFPGNSVVLNNYNSKSSQIFGTPTPNEINHPIKQSSDNNHEIQKETKTVTSEKDNLFDIFWNSNEENDILESWS